MSRARHLWGLVALLFAGLGHAAPATTDPARLRALPPGFTRPVVWVLPVLDQRALALDEAPAAAAAWTEFVDALDAARNLDVRRPKRTRASIAASEAYRRALPLARQFARQGMGDYQRVRLEEAATALGQAVDGFMDIGHHIVAPDEVGRVELTRGLALLEADARGADDALRRALIIDPTLRLKAGVDRPEAVEAVERARATLARALPTAQALFARRPPVPGDGVTVQARIAGRQLEVVVYEGGRVTVERQQLGVPSAGERLASRVWACLPFGRGVRRRRSSQRLYLDAGFDSFFFAEAPTELYRNVGVTLNASWSVARFLAFDANLALTNSGRDREEDLRVDVPVGRLVAGPNLITEIGRLRLGAAVGIEVASIAPVTITTDADCKYYEPGQVDPRLCDFERDFARADLSWSVGAALTLGATLRASDRIYLGVRLRATSYVFQSVDNGLDKPVGGQFVLGYQLF